MYASQNQQIHTRVKYERIRCPICGSISRVLKEYDQGYQERVCRQGHLFSYDYLMEAFSQFTFNYKQKY